jgi:hypothetical protein
MIKHFFSVLIFIFFFIFIFFVVSTYISNTNREKVIKNRTNIYSKIKEKIIVLPLLKNNTNDVIEFNSGYNDNKSKVKRNFWNLFKKND